MRQSRLPEGGTNLFQQIKGVCAEAEAAGQTLYRLSIGQPTGPALPTARRVAAEAIASTAESMHEYQDNGTPGVPGFAERFVAAHVATNLAGREDVSYLPIPGIKPMLGLIPLACGAKDVMATVQPGYPTPVDWCDYLNVSWTPLTTTMENQFRFDPGELDHESVPELAMLNYPHNPTAQVATREWWQAVCEAAIEHNVRLFNDAAYAILAHTSDHCTLADVAVDFPELSWAEAFSASKAGNFTGWRVGAIVGSPDFVDDIGKIKGNTDSGLVAPMAAGVSIQFENGQHEIDGVRRMYKQRMDLLVKTLQSRGMRLAVKPSAGFFTLWQKPKMAFGQSIDDAWHFNRLMIEETGVVGVHFDPYIRYAVCSNVESMIESIDAAFRKAEVSYER